MTASHRPLTAQDLLPSPLQRLGRRIYLHASIPSTNTFLLEHAAEAGDGAVAWAESQAAGRGRLGRRWLAPRGSSVLLSVLLLEPPDSPLRPHAALLGTVAACEAVETATDCAPAVRWPNDVYLGGRKLGGVLAESSAGVGGVVIGVGLNCLQHRRHFTAELRDTATSLECESRHAIDRAAVAAALLARLDNWFVAASREPAAWAKLREAWRQRCEDLGRPVALEHDGRSFRGTAVDIAENGDLIVQLDHGGRRHFASANTTRAG